MEERDKLLKEPLKWYHYIAGFFAGMFLTNAIPHFVNGLSGNPFPTPFADPPIQRLSSPLTNIYGHYLTCLQDIYFLGLAR